MLCYTDSGVTVPIAYDQDSLAKPLADKLRDALGERGGSQSVTLSFSTEERDLQRQFEGCAYNIRNIWDQMAGDFRA